MSSRKTSEFDEIPGLVASEGNWNAFDAGYYEQACRDTGRLWHTRQLVDSAVTALGGCIEI